MPNKYFKVGFVKEIRANKILVQLYETNNSFVYFHKGKEYSGISIGGYIGIINGPHTVVAQIDKEFLEDVYKDAYNQSFERERYIRLAEATIVGYFDIQQDKYIPGLKILPMIYNEAILLSQEEVLKILNHNGIGKKPTSEVEDNKEQDDQKKRDEEETEKSKESEESDESEESISDYPIVGNLVFHDIPFYLNWEKLFNTHIGIFGNTGSGKSNTLAKLYTELFNMRNSKLPGITNSQFIVLDFNGEYVGDSSFGVSSNLDEKSVIELSTRSEKGEKIRLSREDLFDVETLSILFSATDKTQKPFIKNSVDYYHDNVEDKEVEDLIQFIGSCFYNTFMINTREAYEVLLYIYEMIGIEIQDNIWSSNENKLSLKDLPFGNATWQNKLNTLKVNFDLINDKKPEDIVSTRKELEKVLMAHKKVLKESFDQMDAFDEITLALYSRFLFELYYGTFHYEHISPLLNRVESRVSGLKKVITTDKDNGTENQFLNIISLKDCNIEMKKTLPLLIVKRAYNTQKTVFDKREGKQKYPKGITQLIIDEAHNILSSESTRETAQWKDYRLETFEELIKEGRKFGFYLTISSQRPSDISETIISQIHNYFIHRLVNENDIRILANSISTLDAQSRHSVPYLAPGQCIVTGTSYYTPTLVQMRQLDKHERPQSDDVDLRYIWSIGIIENKGEKGEDIHNETQSVTNS